MEGLYLGLLVLLLGIALFDLVVGVSNDAVNFLTSAIGSNAATFRTIMIVASIGVFIGASSSGGMMEIAKRGVFNPSYFSFQNIIFMYVVVMLTDILLLDFFNSVKLPTSTTISIVFELLGASLATSFLIVYDRNESISHWFGYINNALAVEMVSAIFISVAVAFAVGWLTQYIIRALVTFRYKKYMKFGGSLFGGLSFVIVLNFIIRVALKNSPLHSHEIVLFLLDQTLLVFLAAFLVGFTIFYLLAGRKDFDAFRVITLIGTFALAMAFASNDLVNFIGVPLAGLEAYGFWGESGLSPESYMMEVYDGPAGSTTANPLYLILAGVVMVLTLWTSKKARNVIKTTVDLSRQSEGIERFHGNEFVRNIVRFFSFASSVVSRLIPPSLRKSLNARYAINAPESDEEQTQAFDLVRASTNLMVAATLITFGTILKLPLSTTYVSFMVLMGTSLADRAWNRDSAVYRVSGVVTVIGGWFVTGITALSISAIFAILVYKLQFIGILLVLGIVVLGIIIINRFTDNEVKTRVTLDLPENWFAMPYEETLKMLKGKTKEMSGAYREYLEGITTAIFNDDGRLIRDLTRRVNAHLDRNYTFQAIINENLKSMDYSNLETGRALIDFYVQQSDLLEQLEVATRVARLHILNFHSPLLEEQKEVLVKFKGIMNEYLLTLENAEANHYIEIRTKLKDLASHAEDYKLMQVKGIIEKRYSFKNSQLFLTTLLRNLDVSGIFHRMYQISESMAPAQPAKTI